MNLTEDIESWKLKRKGGRFKNENKLHGKVYNLHDWKIKNIVKSACD